uniref:HAP1 N-terminal domain-containing protein n=1 Tax=Acrobeloides nanus TaxID=290746 RepID=A0A914CCV9_9BILA
MSEDAIVPNEYDSATIAKLIEEKERDLELVSKVGLDLLKQNQELKERNDFLQVSIKETNEVITQLQHDLKIRNSLLQTVEDYENDCYAISDSGERIGIVERLKEKVNQLENENAQLRNESTKLRQQATDVQEISHDRIDDYLKQLENANLRISKLQMQIGEKNSECAHQAEEMRRLLNELTSMKSREKSINRTNEELNHELDQAIAKHEELKSEIINLQELYVDVKSNLAEAEEELRGYRVNLRPHRSLSTDSLYDSLASELEANDSGFYTTPMISARNDSRQSTQNDSCFLSLQEEIERLRRLEEPIAEASNNEFMTVEENQVKNQSPHYVEVPNRVLLRAYQRSLSADRHRRLPKDTKPIPLTWETELPTPTVESVPGSSMSKLQRTMPLQGYDAICTENEIVRQRENNSSPQLFNRNGKTYRNHGCSPVRMLSPPRTESVAIMVTPHSDSRIESSSCCSSASTSPEGTLIKSTSTDSLVNYEGRKLGEPGKPGTRDLDYSLQRVLNIRKIRQKVAQDYKRYRREQGLPASIGLFDLKSTTKNFHLSANDTPFSKYFRKAASLEQQQLWKRLPSMRNLGLESGIQIPPIAAGVFHRNNASPNGTNSFLTTNPQAAVPNPTIAIETPNLNEFIPQQSYSDGSIFGFKSFCTLGAAFKSSRLEPFQHMFEESTTAGMATITTKSGPCSTAQNQSSIVQRGAF